MSLYTNQTNITQKDYFFLLANVSTLTANNIRANTIQTSTLTTSSLTANVGLIDTIDANYISTNLVDTFTLSSQNLEANFGFVSSLEVLGGFVSSLITNNIVLDGNYIDTGGQGFGAVLLLNGLPIATGSSTLSSIQDWSYFPAVSTLFMNSNNIVDAGNITCQNIYNALNIQTDTLAALTSYTAPTGIVTNLRTTNLSSVNLTTSNVNCSGLGQFATLTTNTMSSGSVVAGVGRIRGLSSVTLSTGTINGTPYIAGSNWSQYPAISLVNLAGNTLSNTASVVGTNIGLTTTSNIGLTAGNDINMNATDYNITADGGLIISDIANINLTAQNGNRGAINLTANSGFNNGVAGQIFLTANGGQVGGVGTGGTIELTANTPIGFSNLTSKITLNASGINSYAGSIPALASAYGYNFIYGQNGVYIASGLPPGLPNVPGTTYIYGTLGIEMPSDAYMKNIYPYFDGITTPPDLNIEGRYIVPNLAQVCVRMSNVRQINFQENVGTYMSNCDNITMSSNGSITTSNLSATNGTIGTLSNTNLVGTGTVSGYNTVSATNVSFTTASGTTVNSASVNTNNLVASNSITTNTITSSNLMSTTAMNLSSINGFTSFGTKSIRVQGDVAQIQLSNNNPGGAGTILNLLSRVATSEIQSFNSNFTSPLPLLLNASYTSTTALYASTINGQALPYPYGSFTANSNQTLGAPNTACSTILDTTEISAGGVSIVRGVGTKVAVSTSGVYRFLASPQFDTSSGGQNTVDFWFQKNGTAVPRSASRMTIQNNGEVFTSVEVILPMNAQDTIETCFTSSDTNMTLSYSAPTGVIPAVPSMIFNAQKIAES